MNRPDFRQALMAIQMEYVEMPGLTLTLPQVERLWNLPIDLCQAAIAVLVTTGFLAIAPDGSFRRRGAPPVGVANLDPMTWMVGGSRTA